MSLPSFPPPYSVRISKKAKRISLRIRPSTGLEIILPQSASDTNTHDILIKFQPWIERHYPRIMEKDLSFGYTEKSKQPKNFFLYGGKIYVIFDVKEKNRVTRQSNEHGAQEYHHKNIYNDTLKCSVLGNTLSRKEFIATYPEALQPPFSSGSGDIVVNYLYAIKDFDPARKKTSAYLKKWLKQQAQEYITPMIKEESRKYSLPYNKLTFRFQKTRWGSCSSKKNISLNANLIFLPEHLIRYIILHELSHTKVMNHSEQYWKVLFSLDEQALKHDKAMRNAWRYVPTWFLAMM